MEDGNQNIPGAEGAPQRHSNRNRRHRSHRGPSSGQPHPGSNPNMSLQDQQKAREEYLQNRAAAGGGNPQSQQGQQQRPPRPDNPQGNRPPQGQRPPQGDRPPQGQRPPQGDRPPQAARPPQGDRPPRPEGAQGEPRQDRNERQNRPFGKFGGNQPPRRKTPAEETIDDIKIDISRLEKEIELEILEIRNLTLGI